MDSFSALATAVVSIAFAEALCWGDHLAEAAPPPSFYAAASFVLTPVAFFLGVAAIHARVAAALHPAGRHAGLLPRLQVARWSSSRPGCCRRPGPGVGVWKQDKCADGRLNLNKT